MQKLWHLEAGLGDLDLLGCVERISHAKTQRNAKAQRRVNCFGQVKDSDVTEELGPPLRLCVSLRLCVKNYLEQLRQHISHGP